MEDTKLVVTSRTEEGSANARRLRKSGILPGVIYAEGKEATAIQMDMHDVEQLLHHHSSESLLVEIEMDGKDTNVLIKDVQHHPVTGSLIHLDLQRVAMDKVIHASIPIEVVGDCAGVKAGGVLDHLLHEIDVECLPGDLTEAIEVDVTNLQLGDLVTVASLNDENGKFKFLTDETTGVVTVGGIQPEADEDGENEPEVIGEKKAE